MKWCSRCDETKPIDAFAPRRNRPSGRQTWCRDCKAEISRQYWQETRDQRHRVSQAWRDANPGYFTAWNRAHPDKVNVKTQQRRARHRGAPGRASEDAIRARVDYYGGRCWMCGEEADTLDHVMPLSRGGSNWPANLRPACRRCNAKKGARVA